MFGSQGYYTVMDVLRKLQNRRSVFEVDENKSIVQQIQPSLNKGQYPNTFQRPLLKKEFKKVQHEFNNYKTRVNKNDTS